MSWESPKRQNAKQLQLPLKVWQTFIPHLQTVLLFFVPVIAAIPNLGFFPQLYVHNELLPAVMLLCWLANLVLAPITAYFVFASPPKSGFLNFISFSIVKFSIISIGTGYCAVQQAIEMWL
jgi:hypothetical protein